MEGVIRQHSGADLLGNLQDEGIAAADGAGRRGDQFSGQKRRFVLGALGLVDAVRECCIDDDSDGVDLMLLHEGGDCVIKLAQARCGAALGGDIGAIDDHMGSDHWGM